VTSTFSGLRRAKLGVGLAGSAELRPRRGVSARSRTRTLFVLVAPSVVLLLIINIYPLFYAAFQSLHNGTLISSGSFVGLSNFADVLTSQDFIHAITFTAIFTFAGVFGSWLVGLSLALLLQLRIPAKGLFRVLLLLPWVVPIVVSSTSWNWLLATPESPVPRLANALGFGDVQFLADPVLAAVVVCIFKVWVSFPFMMLMSSSALASVDKAIYEAAAIDGASAWQKLTRITLPMIARPTYVSWVLMVIFCVNDFATIFLLTGGGPVQSTTTLVLLAYERVFQNFQIGQGVAIAFVLTLFLVAASMMLIRQIRRSHV
jgi:multiple sugar transport system permease protein